jgi:hypothetical protein
VRTVLDSKLSLQASSIGFNGLDAQAKFRSDLVHVRAGPDHYQNGFLSMREVSTLLKGLLKYRPCRPQQQRFFARRQVNELHSKCVDFYAELSAGESPRKGVGFEKGREYHFVGTPLPELAR